MHRYLRLAACLALALALSLISALAEENLVVNGDFSLVEDGWPTSWRKDMWYTDEGVSVLTVEEDGYEGACVSVDNVAANDARFAQTIAVEPDSIY